MVSRIVHPRMMKVLEKDFFPQLCTLKEPVKSRDSSGEEIRTYVVRAGYEELPCRVAPAGGSERRGNQFTHLDATHAIALPGQFADLTEEWIAVVDDQEYQILNVGKDAEGVMTHLETRVVR